MLARPSVAFAVGHTGASKVVIGKLDDVVIGDGGKVVNSKLDDQPGPGHLLPSNPHYHLELCPCNADPIPQRGDANGGPKGFNHLPHFRMDLLPFPRMSGLLPS